MISNKYGYDTSMVLYSKIRPYLMKVSRPSFDGLCSADVYPLKPVEGTLDRDFLFYILLSKTFTDYAIAGSARAGMPKVNRKHLFAYELAIPNVAEQREIAKTIDNVAAESSDLKPSTPKSWPTSTNSNNRSFKKAFTGQLTTTKARQYVEVETC
ncbi:MAG: restriction endonuclease subunit S [Mariniblastus sp.]